VAAPVFARGVATGAISVIGPRESMRNHLDAVVPPLRRTAEQISALLTGPPPGEPHTTEGAPSLAARLPGELLTRGRD
jgi:hypothetical protein